MPTVNACAYDQRRRTCSCAFFVGASGVAYLTILTAGCFRKPHTNFAPSVLATHVTEPKDEAGKKVMMTKELNNGRLAMLATIGVWAQELVDGKTILGHLFG